MIHQFPVHGRLATRAEQRVAAKGLIEEPLEWFAGKNTVAVGIGWWVTRKELLHLMADGLVADVAVQAIIADPLKSLGQQVLDHATDESQDGQGLVLDGLSLMVFIPIANGGSVVLLDASY